MRLCVIHNRDTVSLALLAERRNDHVVSRKTCAQVVAHAVKYAKPGSTVLMHMHTASFTTTCMGQLFVALYKQRGLLVCRVYRGADNVGPVVTTPRLLPGQLPCGSGK